MSPPHVHLSVKKAESFESGGSLMSREHGIISTPTDPHHERRSIANTRSLSTSNFATTRPKRLARCPTASARAAPISGTKARRTTTTRPASK